MVVADPDGSSWWHAVNMWRVCERQRLNSQSVLQVKTEEWDYGSSRGYFVLVDWDDRTARIVSYCEDSYFSSREGLGLCCHCGFAVQPVDGEDDDVVVWRGTWEALFHMAVNMIDPAMTLRRMQPDDHMFKELEELFLAVVVWRDQGCPRWAGRRGDSTNVHGVYSKTPLAQCVVARAMAATRIQACFRGWWWRLHVLFNPHTPVGAAYLMRQWRVDALTLVPFMCVHDGDGEGAAP